MLELRCKSVMLTPLRSLKKTSQQAALVLKDALNSSRAEIAKPGGMEGYFSQWPAAQGLHTLLGQWPE